MGSGAELFHCAEHGHRKMGCRGVRGRVMWLTPSFGNRVKHGERPLNAAKGTSSCAWFVKWVNLVSRVGRFDRLRDRMVSLSNHPGFRGLWGFARVGRFDRLSDRRVRAQRLGGAQ